jgi:hypothetical protein
MIDKINGQDVYLSSQTPVFQKPGEQNTRRWQDFLSYAGEKNPAGTAYEKNKGSLANTRTRDGPPERLYYQ